MLFQLAKPLTATTASLTTSGGSQHHKGEMELNRKIIPAIIICIAIGAFIFYFFGMRYLSPIETISGEVIEVLFEWMPGGPDEPDHYYTWVIIRDAQSAIWIFQHDEHEPFEIGESYTFEVHMWPCGGYTGPHVDHMTDVYPIASYE